MQFRNIISNPFENFQQQEAKQKKQSQRKDQTENQLHVQVTIKNRQRFEPSTQRVVDDSEMNVTCLMNRTRITYNIETIINVIRAPKELDYLMASQQRNEQQIIKEFKVELIHALMGKTASRPARVASP